MLGGARRGAGKEAPDLGLPLSGPLPQLYLHLLAKELRRGLRSALLTLTLGARTSLWWPTASSGPVGQSGQSLPTPRPPAASQSVLCTLCKPGRRRPRGSAQLVLPGSGAAVLRAGPGPGAIPTGGRAAGGGGAVQQHSRASALSPSSWGLSGLMGCRAAPRSRKHVHGPPVLLASPSCGVSASSHAAARRREHHLCGAASPPGLGQLSPRVWPWPAPTCPHVGRCLGVGWAGTWFPGY